MSSHGKVYRRSVIDLTAEPIGATTIARLHRSSISMERSPRSESRRETRLRRRHEEPSDWPGRFKMPRISTSPSFARTTSAPPARKPIVQKADTPPSGEKKKPAALFARGIKHLKPMKAPPVFRDDRIWPYDYDIDDVEYSTVPRCNSYHSDDDKLLGLDDDDDDDDDDDESLLPSLSSIKKKVAAAEAAAKSAAAEAAKSIAQEEEARNREQARKDKHSPPPNAPTMDPTVAAALASLATHQKAAAADTSTAAATAKSVADSLAQETAARKHDVARLDGRIDHEEQARKDNAARMDGLVAKTLSAVESTAKSLAQEKAARKQDVARLDGRVDAVDDKVTQLQKTVEKLKAERPSQQLDFSSIPSLNLDEETPLRSKKPAARKKPKALPKKPPASAVKKPKALPKKPPASAVKKPPASKHANMAYWLYKPHFMVKLDRNCISCENAIAGNTPGRCHKHNKNLSDADLL